MPADRAGRRRRTGAGRRTFLALAVPVGLAVGISLWRAAGGDPFTDAIEDRLIDLRIATRGPLAGPSVPVVVEVDEEAVDRLGWSPPPRAKFAEAIERIADAGPAVIAVDLLFLDATPADEALASAIREAGVPVVLGAAVSFAQGGNAAPLIGPAEENALARSALSSVTVFPIQSESAPRVYLPSDRILDTAFLGHVNITESGDRAARRIPLAQWTGGGRFLPALSLVAARVVLGLSPGEVVLRAGKGVQLGDSFVPTDGYGQVVVNHLGPPGAVERVALLDVLDGRVSPERFAGRPVFLGATAESLSDLFATPFGGAVPGVEILATLTDNLVSDSLPRAGPSAGTVWYALPPLLALLVALAARVSAPLAAAGAGLAVWAGGLGLLQLVFQTSYRLPDATGVVLALLTATAWAIWRRMADDRWRTAALASERANLARYVSPFLAEDLARTRSPTFVNRRQNAAILFVDVAGYTALSENLSPSETAGFVTALQRFYEECATDMRGVLASFQGDGVMIVFGLPVADPSDASRAIACGRALLDGAAALKSPVPGAGPITLRVSLHYGSVVAGIVGGDHHAQVTVNGDTVNVASRLQDVAKEHGSAFVISRAAYDAAGSPDGFDPIGAVGIRGRADTVEAMAAGKPA